MCVTNIYVDLYPSRRREEFRQTSICQYGLPGRPCAKTSLLENPVRKIQFGEPTTEYMLTSHQRVFPAQTYPSTPPRSSGGSHHRRSGEYSSGEEAIRGRRRDSKPTGTNLAPDQPRRATREHRKERIIIVDSPPTPRTPPQVFNQVFTAPNSPATHPGRPIIVDERPRPPPRVPSVGAVVGDRIPIIVRRSTSTSRTRNNPPASPRERSTRYNTNTTTNVNLSWDSPSSSHTSFDLQMRAEEASIDASKKRTAQKQRERNERIAHLEAESRRASFIARQDEEIRRRPAIPLVSRHNTMSGALPIPIPPAHNNTMSGGNGTGGNLPFVRPQIIIHDNEREGRENEARRIREERERAARLRWEAVEEEALRQRLRERQLPSRRFSVGPAQRRRRVLYDDGVYRWE